MPSKTKSPRRPTGEQKTASPTLLAGGNPQVAKADGDDAVETYLSKMPGWKQDIGRKLDALIVGTVPGVRKAVRYNSPFYGAGSEGWFASFHCLKNYVKLAFFRGTSLTPMPPGESKNAETRYLDVKKDQLIDEDQLRNWFEQAAALPGLKP